MPQLISERRKNNELDIPIGQRVRTDWGKGYIRAYEPGKPGWRWPRYFWVELTDGTQHLFAPNEIAKILW